MKTKRANAKLFDSYQKTSKVSRQFEDPNRNYEVSLYSLQVAIAGLQSIYGKRKNGLTTKALTDTLGDLLWHIGNLASHSGIKLSKVAADNLKKIVKDYKAQKKLNSKGKGHLENLPNNIEIAFIPWKENQVVLATKLSNGEPIQIGDRIDDNSHVQDYYRFHDVLHLSFMVHLDWSPVMRALLKRKRKNSKALDRVEDGARAAGIEEAISAAIFKVMERQSGRSEVPLELLKFIKQSTSGLEVGSIKFSVWEKAIIEGLRAFDSIKRNGGVVVARRGQRPRLIVKPLTSWWESAVDKNKRRPGTIRRFRSSIKKARDLSKRTSSKNTNDSEESA